MIISHRRQLLVGPTIEIDRWLRAPISLDSGSRYFAAFDPVSHAQAPEIILTTIPPEMWPDLWRMELETLDTLGNLNLVIKILAHYNIEILAAEGSINAFGQQNSMSFILSCLGYNASRRDRTSPARVGSSSLDPLLDDVRLQDLEHILKLNFSQSIAFNDLGHPQLKIRRMAAHWQLHEDWTNKRIELIHGVRGARIENNRIGLDEETYGWLRDKADGDLFYSTSVDTKDRLIRIHIFGAQLNPMYHLQLLIGLDHTSATEIITEILRAAQCNVLKFQIRPTSGSLKKPDDQEGYYEAGEEREIRAKSRSTEPRICRVDLTFEIQRPRKQHEETLAEVHEALRNDVFLRNAYMKISKSQGLAATTRAEDG